MRLIVEGLSCIRGGRRVFQGVSCRVGAGEALLVTGPNGAGKTSFLRLIAGLLQPAAGSIRIEGPSPEVAIGEVTHFVGHVDAVKGALSVAENIAFARGLAGDGAGNVKDVLARFGLEPLADFPARELSAGQRRRIALARLLAAPRTLWLLDEPTAALDAEGQATFKKVVDEHLSSGGIVLATTHLPLQFSNAREIQLGGDRR
jgi:heme exporter protein A